DGTCKRESRIATTAARSDANTHPADRHSSKSNPRSPPPDEAADSALRRSRARILARAKTAPDGCRSTAGRAALRDREADAESEYPLRAHGSSSVQQVLRMPPTQKERLPTPLLPRSPPSAPPDQIPP